MTRMMSRPGIVIAAVVILSVIFGLHCTYAEDSIGKIQRVQNAGFVLHAGQADYQPAQRGEPISVGDSLITDPEQDSKIWWNGDRPHESDVSMGRNSIFVFVGFQTDGRASQFAGQISQGIIRFRKNLRAGTPQSSFTIFSPTALASAMPTRDTADFVVESLDEYRTSVTVIRGEVRVSNVREDITAERLLRACETVIVEKDREPGPVMRVSSEYLRALIDFTTIPNTLPRTVPACERPPAPPQSPLPLDYYESFEPDVIIVPGESGFYPIPVPVPWPTPPLPTYPTMPTVPTTPTTPTTPTSPTTPTTPTTPTIPTRLTIPTVPTIPTTPTTPTTPTVPTRLTIPTRLTLPTPFTVLTIPTRPTRPTIPTRLTLPTPFTVLTIPTRPTRFTFPTRVTLPTRFTIRTIRTFPTIPTVRTFPTRFTISTFPTLLTIRTFPTLGTLPTIRTFPTIRTIRTFATLPTIRTVPTFPTIRTIRTFPTRFTIPTRFTVRTFPTRFTVPTMPTIRTKPTVGTVTRPTVRIPTRRTVRIPTTTRPTLIPRATISTVRVPTVTTRRTAPRGGIDRELRREVERSTVKQQRREMQQQRRQPAPGKIQPEESEQPRQLRRQ